MVFFLSVIFDAIHRSYGRVCVYFFLIIKLLSRMSFWARTSRLFGAFFQKRKWTTVRYTNLIRNQFSRLSDENRFGKRLMYSKQSSDLSSNISLVWENYSRKNQTHCQVIKWCFYFLWWKKKHKNNKTIHFGHVAAFCELFAEDWNTLYNNFKALNMNRTNYSDEYYHDTLI